MASNTRSSSTDNMPHHWQRTYALSAVNAARSDLNRIAMLTDSPDWSVVNAADLLDEVAALLERESNQCV